MIKRRRTAVLAAFAVVASVFLLPASPASAATFDNACVNSLIPTQSSLIPITMTGTASAPHDPAQAGDTVTLSNIQQHADIPPAVFVAGYNAGVLTTGVNNIPITIVQTVIEGTNTVQGTQTTNNPGLGGGLTASTTITDPNGIPGTGDETATPGSLNVTYADQTWTALANGPVEFREDTVLSGPLPPGFTNLVAGIRINAVVAGVITVRFGCDPGTVVESADPSTIVLTDPAVSFATTEPPRQISINDVSHNEGNSGQTAYDFTVSLDHPSVHPVTVNFATANGTATAPSDYTANSGTVTFAPGDTSKTVTVQVNGDTTVEPNETFNVNLSGATGNATITDAQGVGTIVNDDTPAPTVTALSPTHGAAAGGNTVTLTGTDLTGTTAVHFGANAATGVTVINATTVTAVAPAGTQGTTVDVTATTPGGTSSTAGTGNDYTYDAVIPAPTVTALNPTHGPAGGGNSVTITGTDFTGATSVHFGANAATGVTVVNATTITANAPAGTQGTTVDVTVTTPAGTSSGAGTGNDYTYDAVIPAPTVTALNPTHGPAGGGNSVTITGTDFTGATSVHFGANAATGVTVVNATTITANAPAGTQGTTVDVTVTTPAGTSSGAGTGNDYTYDAVIPAPTVTALNPTHGPAGGGNSVTITGTDFTGATSVHFGANAATGVTVVNATTITANAPAGTQGTTVDVTVTTPAGTSSGAGTGNDYTYDAVIPAPTVTALNPTHGPAGGGNSVTITGTDFTGATSVHFGANAATGVTVVNATTITANAPAGTQGTTVDVTVTTPAGTSSGAGTGNDYTYDAVIPAPTVTALNPTHGPAGGGNSVTITGTDFTGATSVHFGANAATGVTVVNATTITANAPAGTQGTTVDVTVTTPAGTSSGAGTGNDYTYDAVIPAPTVTALNPTHGPAGGGNSVTITGTDFTGATSVHFGANAATGVTVVNATTITANAPAGTQGTTVDVTVTTPAGTSSGAGTGNDYTYDAVVTPSNITINDVSHNEGNSGTTAYVFTVSLSAAQAAPVTVNFATADGTATAPSDYTANSGTVTFAPGDTSKTVTVQVNGDTTVEPNETFNVNLSGATGNATITDAQGVGTIVNDDQAGSVNNACVNSLIPTQASLIPVVMTANASPNPVSPGGTVTLSNINQHLAIPPQVFVAGYNATNGTLIHVGANNIPITDIHTVIEGTNTVEGTQTTNAATATATTTITDPDGVPGTGDETATPGTVDVTYANQTWTAGASGTINFREDTVTPLTTTSSGINITAVIAGAITVRFGCDPGEVVEGANPSTIVLTDPAPSFASTQIQQPAASNITINDVSHNEGNSGQTAYVFTVSLSAPQAAAVTVNFATANGTATAPSDYTANSGTVTFAPGVTSQTVTVQVNGDTTVEPNETFNVNLSGATGNATITDAQGVGTIVNDDQAQCNGPSISKLFPNVGIANIGGITLISGQHFTGATSVKFGSTPAKAFKVLSDSQIVAIAPPLPAGTVDVRVTGPCGTSPVTAGDKFTYVKLGHKDDHH